MNFGRRCARPGAAHGELPLRVGLVGCGRWGRLILRDLKALGCWVVVAARSPASIANAQAAGADAVVADIDELPPVDAVDSVKQEVRCSDIHLGRLVGDDCRRLTAHGCRSAE